MIEAYFGFKQMPFAKDIKSEKLFESYDVREATARLAHVRNYRGIMMLTGEPGSGKTSVVRRFVDTLNPQSYLHCYTPHVTVKQSDLYRQLNLLLRLPQRTRKSDLFTQVQSAIWEQYIQGKITCIILDECQLMEHASLQELVLLTNFEMDSKLPFILLLIGQPEFKDVLARTIHEPLKQRINVRYHMAGLSLEDTKLYVEHHLQLVGRKDPLIESGAYQVIHQLSHGLPRKIGKLVLAALQMAMIEKKQIIDADLIIRIAAEV